MTQDKDNDYHGIAELEALSQRYRDNSAPLGFATRVSALSQERHNKRFWQSPLLLGAGFATAVVAVLMVMPLYMDSDGLKPLNQPGPTVATGPKQPELVMPDKQVTKLDDSAKRDRDNKAGIDAAAINTVVVASDSDFDTGNLSDAASWMASQETPEMPDFSDIPSPMELMDTFSSKLNFMKIHYAYRLLPQRNYIKQDVKESNDETV